MPDRVRLVPRYVSGGEADALYRRADVIALPYEDDDRIDQSGVLSHALGAGRAIVCSTVRRAGRGRRDRRDPRRRARAMRGSCARRSRS